MFLDNSYIYICTGEYDNNTISLHDIDWKIKMNNRHTLKIVSCLKNYCCHNDNNTHIVNLLHLPKALQKHVSHEFEYQLQLEFDIFLESTINYKYPNEY